MTKLRGVRARIGCAGRTDVGRLRSTNEDSLLMSPESGVFVVADGVGGRAAGDVASEMAVRLLTRELGVLRNLDDVQARERMRFAVRAANEAIFQCTLAEPDKRGMGTTVTGLAIYGARFLVGHVGDSRCYLLREASLTPITRDHSFVQEQVDAGYLTLGDAFVHPYRSVITRCVGVNLDVVPDIYGGPVQAGDVFLLASDGLTGMLDDHQIAEVLSPVRRPRDQVEDLIAMANKEGGRDNITALVVRVDAIDEPAYAARRTMATSTLRPRPFTHV